MTWGSAVVESRRAHIAVQRIYGLKPKDRRVRAERRRMYLGTQVRTRSMRRRLGVQ